MTTGRALVPPPEPLRVGKGHEVPDGDQDAALDAPDADIRIRPGASKKPAKVTAPTDFQAPRTGHREPDWCPQDIVEEWGLQSFPASDAPANW